MLEVEQLFCYTGPRGSRKEKSRDVWALGRGTNKRFRSVAHLNSTHAGIFREMEVHSPIHMLGDEGQAHPVYHHCPAQGQHICSTNSCGREGEGQVMGSFVLLHVEKGSS